MTGPQLKTDSVPQSGLVNRLKWLLHSTPPDFRTVVDWVIKNFQPNDASSQGFNPGGGGSGTITVTVEDTSGYTPGTGVTEVDNVTTITFDQDNFEIFDGGGGQVVVKLKTCPATCV